MPLTPDQYTERRNTLATLLADTTDALQSVAEEAHYIEPGLIQRHIAKLSAIRTKVFEDQFKLVLVARFQGGKSSTFNAIALDGQAVSPMGGGAIKCSATLLAVRNCENPAQRGVTLQWRTLAELSEICAEVLVTHGPADFTTTEGRLAARAVYDEEFELYKKNRTTYPETKRELLPIVDFITRFVGDPRLGDLQERLRNNPPTQTELARYVRFPEKFVQRWPGQFTLEEAMFVFLQSSSIAAEAPALQRLGFQVFDCPGLLASNYDTSIATSMIAKADAVWFLLDGIAAGESDLKAIALCRRLVNDALFISVNLKSGVNPTRKHITTKIMPHIESQLADAGLTVVLHAYHALLALLAKAGAELLRGKIDPATTDFMRGMVDDMVLVPSTPDASGLWAALCDQLLDRLKSGVQEFRAAGGQLNPETLAIVERESGLAEILGHLEQFIIGKRAKSVLIDNGVGQAIKALIDGVQHPLAALEAVTTKDEDQARAEFQSANAALTQFEQLAEQQLKFIEGQQGDLLDQQLAGEFFDEVILGAIPEVAKKSSDEIVAEVGMWATIIDVSGGKKHGETIQRIIERDLSQVVVEKTKVWAANLGPQTSPAVSAILKQAELITKSLEHTYQGSDRESPQLKHLHFPLSLGTGFESKNVADLLTKNRLIDLLGVTLLVFELYKLLTNSEKKLRAKVAAMIVNELEKKLSAQRRALVLEMLIPSENSSESLRFIREQIVTEIKAPIREMRERFDAQRRDAETILNKKAEENDCIAEHCRRLREDRIVPLRERLENYRNQTEWIADIHQKC